MNIKEVFMLSDFLLKFYSVHLDGEGKILTITSQEKDFLGFSFNEFNNTFLIDWVFEPQKKVVKEFLQHHGQNHLGVWFTDKRDKHFWCLLIHPKETSETSNEVIVYDYTYLVPYSGNVFLINPLFFTFFSELNIPIGITNLSGKWIEANPALCDLFGYTKEELFNLTWQEVTPQENLEQELGLFQEVIKTPSIILGKVNTFEKFYVRKDSSRFRALVHLFPIPDNYTDSLYGFLAIIENLDEKEKSIHEAEQAKQFLKIVLDLLPVRVFWKDTNLHYLGCNLAFAKDAGKNSPEEIIGKTDFELPWQSEAEMYRKDDREVISSGKPKIFYEESQTTPDGRKIWLRTSKIPLLGPGGVPYGVLGMYEEITEYKSLISTLSQTMSLLKTLIDSAPVGIIAIDVEGNIEFWNEASKKILGWDIDEVLSKPIRNFAPEIDNYLSQNADTHPLFEVEIIEKNKSGNPLTLRIIHRLIHLSDRSPLNLILFRDISDIKKMQEEKEQFQKQLHYTQKLESLGVLASSIAHDFNNILMAIMGQTELAKGEIHNPDAVYNYLTGIEEAVQNAGDLCRQLLLFSGKKQQPYEPCNLNNIIHEMEHLLKVSISKKILLNINLLPDLPYIEGEPGQIRSVILNLVINASDAIGNRSGVIRINTGVMDFTDSYIRTTWFQEGLEKKNYVFLEVSDTGCGIPPEFLSKIFDPFFTTKEKGRGLGLATIMGIIRAHKGTIKVYSEVGKGTTFKLFFPSLMGKPIEKQKEKEETSWEGKGVILLADDEPVVLQVTTKMLENLGFGVITAMDGREALKLFEENKDKISAVILDITMPHLDGTDVARAIRSQFPELPIFLSSGFSKHSFGENDIDFPIQGFLSKPYNINTLRENLKDYLK